MTVTFLISNSRESGQRQLWAWNPDDPDKVLTQIDQAPLMSALDSDWQLTTVGSFLLCYKPPTSVTPGDKAYVEFMLIRTDTNGDGLSFSLAQQGFWYWDKFTGDYSYTATPGGEQLTSLELMGITGYVMSRLSTPGRSGYSLWNFDPYNDNPGGSNDPIRVSMAGSNAFPNISEDDVLTPILNFVFVSNDSTQSWRLYNFDPQLPNPLSYPEICSGTLPPDLPPKIVAVGDRLLAWTPGESDYTTYEFKKENPFTNPKQGTWPEGFESSDSTTLAALHSRVSIQPELAETPGTMDFMRQNIKHVVCYVLESRSFDSVVGWLYDQSTSADINWVGATAKPPFKGASISNYNEDAQGNKYNQNQYKNGDYSKEFNLDAPDLDPFHGTPDTIKQQWKGGYASYTKGDPADMGGFVLNNMSDKIMATYSSKQLGILSELAKWYGVSDYWFCGEAGGTTTNRATLASGSAYNITATYEGGNAYAEFPKTPHRQSMWKVLANNGIKDWAIYYSVLWENEPYTYHLFLEGQLPSVDYYPGQYVQPIDSFFDAAKSGNLPAFCFLEPVWVDPSGMFTSYHPAGDVLPGEQALQNIFEALMKSPCWNETALVISFSKGGGMYDHEPAQPMLKAWLNDGNDEYGFDTTGARVPTLVVSPLVKKNTVFRSNSKYTPFDTTSLPATVLSWFGIPWESWGMGDRITVAPTFEGVFQLSTPRTDPPTLTRAIDKNYQTTGPISVAAPVPVDATWEDNDKNGLFTNYGNWSKQVKDDKRKLPTDVATFGSITNTAINFSYATPQTINQLLFNSEAPSYTFLFDEEKPDSPTLTLAGAGVINQSDQPQTFNVQASSVSQNQVHIAFLNQASAGDPSITYIVGPTTPDSQSGGVIAFNQRATAGSAKFNVSVGKRPPGSHSTVGAEVRFLHNSTAETATFKVTGSTGETDADTFGNVVFHNYATAAKANFNNVGGTVGDGGNTQFFEQTTAANATILNQGATGEKGNGGDTAFDGTATAASAKITNWAASAGNGGVTSFNNNYPYMAPEFGATAGNAQITNKGTSSDQAGTGGHTEFTGIYGSGNAGTATIENFGSDTSGPKGNGYTLFAVNGHWPYYKPSAAQATITNHPGTCDGALGGRTSFIFQDWSYNKGDDTKPGPTAGSATIVNEGATVAGAKGGQTVFDYEANADNATITATGGTADGPGIVSFSRNADGGTASIYLSGGHLKIIGSTRGDLNLDLLQMDQATIEMEIGTKDPYIPCIKVATVFKLSSATANFAFTLADKATIPTEPITLMEANTLTGMKADQFSGTLSGANVSFAIVGNQLKVTFTPTS